MKFYTPVQDGLNWYVYCNNNPLSAKDPTGLTDEKNKFNYGGNYKENDKVGNINAKDVSNLKTPSFSNKGPEKPIDAKFDINTLITQDKKSIEYNVNGVNIMKEKGCCYRTSVAFAEFILGYNFNENQINFFRDRHIQNGLTTKENLRTDNMANVTNDILEFYGSNHRINYLACSNDSYSGTYDISAIIYDVGHYAMGDNKGNLLFNPYPNLTSEKNNKLYFEIIEAKK